MFPLSPADEVNTAADAALAAFQEWRRVPAPDRIQYLFRLKQLMEDNLDLLARSCVEECGKTYNEGVGELPACYREC